MIKNTLIALCLIIALGYGLEMLLSNAIHINYGHHFSFENELGIEIDSLEITVGDMQTMLQAGTDSLSSLGGNIYVPEKGYPHKVTLIIFSNEKRINLEADSFNCYNCDGSHEYILKHSGSEYKFHN